MPGRFNPAPGWPAAPEGWTPGPGWKPDPSWAPAPEGWPLWVDDTSHAAATRLPAPASSPARPWYKKKRYIGPILFVLLIGWIGSLGGNGDADPRTAATATGQQDESQPEEPTAEDIAEQAEKDAAKAEVERIAAEQKAADDAAKAEADRLVAEQKAADDAAKAEADRVAAEQAAAAEAAKGTVSQQNAYGSAQSYLSFSAFSRAGLIDQLTSEYGEGFPVADAEFAVARLEAAGGVDWNSEAAESAKSYLEFSSFSRQGLLDQLTSQYGEQFTREQAEYGVSTTGL